MKVFKVYFTGRSDSIFGRFICCTIIGRGDGLNEREGVPF